ncbi:hypothetical protein FRC09_010633 [Ceratobasidium sp. 395]|nr:hypothetical protein FRC09_010633 [Ceratobasidium sp. 395]
MSAAAWRSQMSYNAYSIICGRALVRSLNENARVAAEKRGLSGLKFQTWKEGKASESQWIDPPKDADAGPPKSAAV